MSSEHRVVQREVARIDNPKAVAGHMTGHRARRLIDGSDTAFTDPFLLMAEDWMPNGAFALHPHRGIETVTFVIEGALEHFDSGGHHGRLEEGDAQWMTAGRGVQHEENAPNGTISHTLQIWINLPARDKMTEPRYQDLASADMPVRHGPGVEARVFSGLSGDVASTTANHVPVTMIDARIQPGATFRHELPGTDNAFLFVLDGTVVVGSSGIIVHAGELAWLTQIENVVSEILLVATAELGRVLIFSGRPVKENVVFGGPFVMNSQEEIRQAFADYRAGRF